MTPRFIESRMEAMAVAYRQATALQIWTWRYISPGMFLAEQVTRWPFECSAEERQRLAKIFSQRAMSGEV